MSITQNVESSLHNEDMASGRIIVSSPRDSRSLNQYMRDIAKLPRLTVEEEVSHGMLETVVFPAKQKILK